MDPLISTIIESFAGAVLFTAIIILMTNSTHRYVITFILQALCLGVLVGFVAFVTTFEHLYVMAVLVIISKAIVIPKILSFVVKKTQVVEEKEPFTNMAFSLIISGVITVLAYFLIEPVLNLSTVITQNLLPLSFAVVMIGFFTLATKKKANTQIMGLLVMENGIYLAAISVTYGMPIYIEIIVSIDILAAILIMAFFLYRIHQNFASLDTTKLNELRE